MLYIVTALYIEAKPLISLFNLKKDNTYTKFQVFSNLYYEFFFGL